MEDNSLQNRDHEIDLEIIMEKIRENIPGRQVAGGLCPDFDPAISSGSKFFPAGGSEVAGHRDLSAVNANWDLHTNTYAISSHHPIVGKFLVQGRRLVHGEVRRYIDPILVQQIEFNASTARIITVLFERCAELYHRQRELDMAFSALRMESDKKITDGIITSKSAITKNDSPVSDSTGNTNYFLFEERFRGSRNDVKQRQQVFIPYFLQCSRILDIGCGRGEFLEILKDRDIGCMGVDSDPDMVACCRSRNLEVEQSDAIAYLKSLEDNSLDGIFIDQVVEHLEPDYLIRLLALCYQKLKSGYYIVIETVNPLTLVSFVNFYIDLTHKRPVHPETLEYLVIAAGFHECEKKFLSTVPDELRLKKIELTADLNGTKRKNVDVYNNNIEMLNTVLFGAQDYAVLAKK
jgi:SAM-dependent methyltransferase